MNLVFLSLLIGCSGCKPKPQEKPPVLEEKNIPEPEEVQEEQEETEEQIIERMVANFQRVYFDVNSSDLNDESRAALDENLEIMQTETQLSIEIQGHADERGTTEYNIALGQRRAKSVQDYFVAQGIAPSRLKVVSYGEEKPLTSGANETAYSKNRRCEFVIIWGGSAEVKGSDQD